LTDDLSFTKFETQATLSVKSGIFENEAAIPPAHSAEGHDASPPLSWRDAPSDAESLVLLMEDPNAAEPRPFVHWVVYDIPAQTTSLREAQPTDPVLPSPEGAKQGINSCGQIGYFGPRPPQGDSPHAYHFQLFALDIP
jgi:Raf kinase inhibitor-like YbhB/YbcL family protein